MAKKRRQRRKATFWTIDAETDPFHTCTDPQCEKCAGGGRIPQPFIWGLYNGDSDTYIECLTVTELVTFLQDLEAESGGTLFYAHNGGKFDYHYLRDEINSDQPILVINGRLAKFKIGAHEFRDSLNLFPNTRLKDFGIKSDIDYAKMEASVRHLHMPEISAYLKQDCVGLWEVIARYRADYGKQLTQASAAMRYWQKLTKIDAPRMTKSQYDELRGFYYGGRVQCLESGVKKQNFEVMDINSAYPFAMLYKHPLSTRYSVDSVLPKRESDIGPCLIRLQCVSHAGALPFRQNNELYFPEDSNTVREYTISGWEWLAAQETNSLSHVKLLDVYQFAQTVDFATYIHHFYELREDARKRGDVAARTFGKYFMNSLYGKFGANPENYCEYLITSEEEGKKSGQQYWEGRGYIKYKQWGSRVLMERQPELSQLNDPDGKWRYYNIATAASVTGFVRAYLYRALSKASGAMYCDTDSISARSFDGIPVGSKLGEWKHEFTGDRYAIAGKKLYAFHANGKPLAYDPNSDDPTWKIASKGVNFAALPDGPDRIIRIASGQSVEYRPEVPTYTITRDLPTFIPRSIKGTAKNMAQVPLA